MEAKRSPFPDEYTCKDGSKVTSCSNCTYENCGGYAGSYREIPQDACKWSWDSEVCLPEYGNVILAILVTIS